MDEKRKGSVRRLFGALWSFVGWLRVSLANLVFLLMLLVLLAVLTSVGLGVKSSFDIKGGSAFCSYMSLTLLSFVIRMHS